MNFSSLPIFNFHMNQRSDQDSSSEEVRPTDQSVIDDLEVVDVTDGRQCSICFEPMADDCLNLTCNHTFHRHCITRWLRRHSTCPNCRAPLMESEEEQSERQETNRGINFIHRIHLQTILSPPTRKTIHFIFMTLNGLQVDTTWEGTTFAYELLIFAKRFVVGNNVKIMYNMGQTQFSFSTSDQFNTLYVSLNDMMIQNHCIMRVYIS